MNITGMENKRKINVNILERESTFKIPDLIRLILAHVSGTQFYDVEVK
ncbi:hypothetical protein [Clostridium sporogenes]